MFEVSVSAAFEACHYIAVDGGPDMYRTMHGHSFLVTATAAAERPGPAGWIIDLGAFEQILKQALAPLEHAILNDVPGLGTPTFENLLLFIEAQLKAAGVTPSRIEIERPLLRQRAVYTPAQTT